MKHSLETEAISFLSIKLNSKVLVTKNAFKQNIPLKNIVFNRFLFYGINYLSIFVNEKIG